MKDAEISETDQITIVAQRKEWRAIRALYSACIHMSFGDQDDKAKARNNEHLKIVCDALESSQNLMAQLVLATPIKQANTPVPKGDN